MRRPSVDQTKKGSSQIFHQGFTFGQSNVYIFKDSNIFFFGFTYSFLQSGADVLITATYQVGFFTSLHYLRLCYIAKFIIYFAIVGKTVVCMDTDDR